MFFFFAVFRRVQTEQQRRGARQPVRYEFPAVSRLRLPDPERHFQLAKHLRSTWVSTEARPVLFIKRTKKRVY